MKHQGYNARLDESMGMKHRGKKMKQSMKDRRDESKGMSKKMYGHSYGGDHSMSYEHKCIKGGKVGAHLSAIIRK
jgi:hypothetical protein